MLFAIHLQTVVAGLLLSCGRVRPISAVSLLLALPSPLLALRLVRVRLTSDHVCRAFAHNHHHKNERNKPEQI